MEKDWENADDATISKLVVKSFARENRRINERTEKKTRRKFKCQTDRMSEVHERTFEFN